MSSLVRNREVGIILAGQGLVHSAYQVFHEDELTATGQVTSKKLAGKAII